jgi:hypothetical protein
MGGWRAEVRGVTDAAPYAAGIASADNRCEGYVPISFTAMMPEAMSVAST